MAGAESGAAFVAAQRWAGRPSTSVEIYCKNTLSTGLEGRVRASFIPGKSRVEGYTPPSPLPSESLDWRGFCKNGRQNLEPQGFRGQNLDNKGLAAFFAVAACTASALTMLYSLACGGQGQMSHDECGVCGFRCSNSFQSTRNDGASQPPVVPAFVVPIRRKRRRMGQPQLWRRLGGPAPGLAPMKQRASLHVQIYFMPSSPGAPGLAAFARPFGCAQGRLWEGFSMFTRHRRVF
jgi:hypothetical protein